MIQQDDDDDRREVGKLLFLVICGVHSIEDVRAELRPAGLDIRERELPDCGHRFVLFWLRTGRVHDHFDFFLDDDEDEDGTSP